MLSQLSPKWASFPTEGVSKRKGQVTESRCPEPHKDFSPVKDDHLDGLVVYKSLQNKKRAKAKDLTRSTTAKAGEE